MNLIKLLFSVMTVVVWIAVPIRAADSVEVATITSPDEKIAVRLQLDDQGQPRLGINYRGNELATASFGLEFAESGPLMQKLELLETSRGTQSVDYPIAVGKVSSATDIHHALVVEYRESDAPHRRLEIAVRVFDDGVAFRYQLPKQDSLKSFVLTGESTRLMIAGDPLAHALPLDSFTTSYENYYVNEPLSKLDSAKIYGLPLLTESPDGVWAAYTEANLTDYAGMYVQRDRETGELVSKLSPYPGRTDDGKVVAAAPFATPWRVLMIADDLGKLIESNLIFHLNPPSEIADASWIVPGKTTFPWWNGYVLEDVDFEPGVNTATMKHYIDFCAENGIPYHSLDGLDIAWYGGPIRPNGPTDVTKAAPSIDMPELLRYAKEKGVRLRLWMHWQALEPQLDEAFATYQQWGIEGVMIDFMDRDDQEMVHWYHEVARKAAEHHLTVTWHGAYKPTGMERTWPNVLSFEGVLNQEYNKFDSGRNVGTPPRHNLDAAFIRMLAGPLDYHQGGMRNKLPESMRFRGAGPFVQGTRGHQLAMFVVYQNHMSMMADSPSQYRDQPGLDFMVDVPANWDETRVLHTEFGECIVIARRKDDRWYVGGMTGDKSRQFELPLDFLGEASYQADLWLDVDGSEPTELAKQRKILDANDTLKISMLASGGFVATITPSEPVASSSPDQVLTDAPEPPSIGEEPRRQIDDVVNGAIEEGQMPGAVVVIGNQNGVLFEKAFGERQVLPDPEPMTLDTVFDLASLTKPIATATSVMKLVEMGKVKLDDPVAKHLPRFSERGKEQVTVQQLMLHVGGLIPDNSMSDYQDGVEQSIDNFLTLPLNYPPGRRFRYSDVGFEVLAELVRSASGQSVDAFARSQVFAPLGMNETGYSPRNDLKARSAPTEKREGEWMRGEVHDPRAFALGGVAGHAGLFSTASDLAIYARAMLGGGAIGDTRILEQATVDRMTKPYEVPGGIRGLGWDKQTGYSSNRGESMSERAYGHGGFTGTAMWIDPGLDLFVIFLSNRLHPDGKGSVNSIAGKIGTIAADALK